MWDGKCECGAARKLTNTKKEERLPVAAADERENQQRADAHKCFFDIYRILKHIYNIKHKKNTYTKNNA